MDLLQHIEASSVGICDIPDGMPLTNRLDKMTTEQANWAIQSCTAWIAYLKEQKASGVDVEIVAYEPKEAYDPPMPAEKYEAICDVLESVWLGLTENMQHALEVEQIPEWVQTLEWAIKVMPAGYEKQQDIIANELREYQPMRKAKR